MWQSRTILVGGKVFTWKGSAIHPSAPKLETVSVGIGSFGPRYFPATDSKEKVEIHCGVFESSEDWQAWMKNIGQHEDCPTGFDFRTEADPSKKPLKSATFEMVVQDAPGIDLKYWWVKDDIQRKPWEE